MNERDERLGKLRQEATKHANWFFGEVSDAEFGQNVLWLLGQLAAVEGSWREAEEDFAAAIRERDAARREAEALRGGNVMPTRVSPEEYKRRTAQAVRLLLAPNGYSMDHVARECGLLPEQVGRTKTVLDVLRWELGYAL